MYWNFLFFSLDYALLKRIRGNAESRWIAWKSGIISLEDVYRETWSPEWGKGYGIRPLSDFLDEETLRSFRGLGSEYYRIISTKVNASESAYALAEGLLERYREAEPELTAMIQGIVEGQGGSMAGLEFRLKSVDSLARKITGDAMTRGITEQDAVNRLTDISRYTGLFDPNSLVSSANKISNLLINEGYSISKIKNSLGGDGIYHGLHMVFEKNGISFELQFHTRQSFDIKMGNHSDYEVWRTYNASHDLRAMVEKWMLKTWKDYMPPKLFDTISDYP